MGHINYRVMIIRCSPDEAEAVRLFCFTAMLEELLTFQGPVNAAILAEACVSGVSVAPINPDSAMIFIKPTGSKEGWAPQEAWKRAIERIEVLCYNRPEVVWAILSMGVDDDEIGMIRSKYSRGEGL